MKISRKQRFFLLRLLSMFSVVRVYNILVIVLAQYLASIFILAKQLSISDVVLDMQLFMLVMATATTIASGYIINSFYDAEKDLINRPHKSMLDRLASPQLKLNTYFVLNFLAVLFASYVSFRAVVFFSIYIFGIWLYSHTLKRLLFVGNLSAAILTILPFFAVFIYYKNFQWVILMHASFLMLLIAIRELIKDLENIKGDLTHGYNTVPVVYGEKFAKKNLTILVALSCVSIIILVRFFDIGKMFWYFYLAFLLLVIFVLLLWRAKNKFQYLVLHNILKIIIVAGVLSITLIDPNRFVSLL